MLYIGSAVIFGGLVIAYWRAFLDILFNITMFSIAKFINLFIALVFISLIGGAIFGALIGFSIFGIGMAIEAILLLVLALELIIGGVN
jgi:hypothetical protein